VVTAQVPPAEGARAPMTRPAQRPSSRGPADLHTRARDCREQARAVVRQSIAVRARSERWGLAASRRNFGVDPCPGSHLLLPAVPGAVRLSRRLVRDLCDLVGLADVADVAQLLAGEILTNVVLHTRTPLLQLAADVSGGTLRVSVSDSNPELPIVDQPSEKEARGRGMMLVNALSKEWGVAQRPGGKLVWFTLSGRSGGSFKSP
jgi:Histidine kinase-like ATPase domain